MKRIVVVALLVVALAAVLGGGLAYGHWRGQLDPVSDAPSPTLFEVSRGASLGGVAGRLESEGLIRSAFALKLLARIEGSEGKLHIGEYELSPHQSAPEVLEMITQGHVKTWPVTLPEGSRASEIAVRLGEAGLADPEAFMAVVEDEAFVAELGIEGRSLEGYLYPDTYQLPRHMTEREVARAMVEQFERIWREEIAPAAAGSELSKAEIVTLASIVEKETAAPEERPIIAAVFLNRLARGMRLETDPTVIYGIEDFDGNIRKRDLLDTSNPYNTYRIKGLPPGPIANPGAEALRAVVTPDRTDYLYFVSRNDGTHKFSSTYREHVNAVNRYQKRRTSR